MSGITSIRSIKVVPKQGALPEERTWKKFVVSAVPIVGSGLGYFFLDTLHQKEMEAEGLNRVAILKVAKLYHLLVGINTATYGLASMTISYPFGSWSLFVGGAAQLFMSLEQFDYVKNTQVLIERSCQRK